MQYEIEIENLPAGFALNHADEGEMIQIAESAFLTDEHGDVFYKFLDAFTSDFLANYLEKAQTVSTIEQALVLIGKNKKATVYINELPISFLGIPKINVKEGDYLTFSDMAGISQIHIEGITIPSDVGIEFFFTLGWRRGVYFDLRPLHSETVIHNLDKKLAGCYEYLIWSNIYSVKASDWEKIYRLGWFPFLQILGMQFEALVKRIQDGASLKSTEKNIIDSINAEKLSYMETKFKTIAPLEPHIVFIKTGIERYLAGDYVSSIQAIWPRIEGILRLVFSTKAKPKQSELLDSLKDTVAQHPFVPTSYLPSNFRDYLRIFYFRDFDKEKNDFVLSRHSLSHGVADINDYDQKRALIGILIIDQLAYYLQLA